VDDVENMKFHYGESIRLTLLLENYTQLAHLLVNAAEGYGDTGDYASASKFLSQARELCDKYDISYLKPTIFLNLGCNLRDLGKNYPESEMYFRAAEKLALELDRKEILGGLYRDWADLYAKSGDYKGYRMVTGKYARHLEEQSGADSRSEYEQIQVLYNLDKITAQKTQLELEVRRRNEMLAVSALILLILGVSVTVISVQYVRLRRYVRTLYRMNVSETRQGIAAESSVPNSFSPESQASYERYQAILKLLTEDKLYLDPQLSLQRLATKLATNQKYLSQAINENSGSNFYGLLKQLRINEARRLILEMGTRTNLQVIAEETGFANRYTFTRQFKEVTGFSPSEFVRLAGTQSGETLNDALTEPEQL
jgi:YesN/AraC family two-component response regulator